ncbi:tetratricopeptide repeat protein [Deinococcus aestuarii]|uniref:tetratricopeptide repeat protein n=1 Tax=Deinococcus aestuarii TaxID=2774531 RepID=UPI001C0ACA9C|nr:tetratricopeptide repeat protein [Deinococcus aestuarii]
MREEGLGRVTRALRAVLARRAGVALGLWGEPGIGKSHAAAELLRGLPCANLSLPAVSPVARLVTALPRPRELPVWTERQLDRLGADGPADSGLVADTLGAVLAGLAPFVLHLDDLHEAGPERVALTVALARVVTRSRGVGLLVGSRQAPPEGFRSERLAPLGREAAAGLLEAQARQPLPPEGLAWVYDRARGNPLFTLEFWRYLVRQGHFWSDGVGWHWRAPPGDATPASVEATIAQTLAGLGDGAARDVVEVRAFLGEAGEDETLWARVAGLSPGELSGARARLEAWGLLRGAHFAHPLFGEVARAGTPPGTRREIARRAVRALADDPERAAGFAQAADLGAEQVRALLGAARLRAEARGDRVGAARWLARSLPLLDPAGRGELALRAARDLLPFDLRQADALSGVAASGTPPDPPALIFRAEVLARLGQTGEAETLLDRVDSPELAEACWRTRIFVRHLRGRREALLALYGAHPEFHPTADTFTLSHVCFALNSLGRPDEAEPLVERLLAREHEGPRDRSTAWNLRGITSTRQGRLEEGAAAFERALASAREDGAPGVIAQALRNSAVACRGLGRLEDAREKLREALDHGARYGNLRFYTQVQDSLARLLVDEGRWREAEACFEGSGAVYARQDPLSPRCEHHLDLAELYLDWRPAAGPPLARRHALAGLALAREIGAPNLLARGLVCAARAEAWNRNAPGALALAREGRALAGRHPAETARSWVGLGAALEVAGQVQEAVRAYLTAAEASAREDDPARARRAELEADRLRGDVGGARAHHAWFLAHGLAGHARVAVRFFPELGQDPPAGRPATPSLSLRVLGRPGLERGGQPLTSRGRKRLELLCLLLEARLAGRPDVGLLDLLDAFYPDEPEAQARLTLRQHVYLTRSQLGAGSICSTPGGYRLGDEVTSDAEAFLAGGDTALWRGPYLEGLGEGWHPQAREALTLALRDAVEHLAGTDPREAARLGLILLETEPYDAQALRLTLGALRESGQLRAASALYARQREAWAEIGEALPGTPEEFLAAPAPGLP